MFGLGRLLRYGLGVSGLDWRLGYSQLTASDALARICARGIDVNTVIDIGASTGVWSEMTVEHLPNARYLLIEALEAHRLALEGVCARRKNFEYVIAAAGRQSGEVYFDDSSLTGGSASATMTDAHKARVSSIAIDDTVAEKGLELPFLIKLDTHGHEVPILEGARSTLESAALVVIEAYNFRLRENTLVFHEICGFMAERGFSVIDISDPLWRVRDKAFWQADLYFVPSARDEFAIRTFR